MKKLKFLLIILAIFAFSSANAQYTDTPRVGIKVHFVDSIPTFIVVSFLYNRELTRIKVESLTPFVLFLNSTKKKIISLESEKVPDTEIVACLEDFVEKSTSLIIAYQTLLEIVDPVIYSIQDNIIYKEGVKHYQTVKAQNDKNVQLLKDYLEWAAKRLSAHNNNDTKF
jgi:hypothetical protein